MNDYQSFLASKHPATPRTGFTVAPSDINSKLFLFQADITRWALSLGKAAIFAERGLGKTAMELEWARHVVTHTGGPVLGLTPLAVAPQHVAEGHKFGIEVRHIEDGSEVDGPGIYVTNYERLHRFDVSLFPGVFLDESGILKHYSKTFFGLTDLFGNTPYRLCATATPAPNDFVELGNHSMFLGIMHFKDMMARWFVGEGDVARVSRLREHGRADFWRWLTSWAVCISHPRDLGADYDMSGFDLPGLDIIPHRLAAPEASIRRAWDNGQLLPDDSLNSTSLHRVKRESLADRVKEVRTIVDSVPAEDAIAIWCDTDYEADALKTSLPEAIEVRGSHSAHIKEERLTAFGEGRERILITKPEVAGYGLNYQHCHHTIFAGVSYSFEQFYQALGRFDRYGQTQRVQAHVIYSETEGDIMQALDRKRKAFAEMQAEMNAAMHEHGLFREDNKAVFTQTEFAKSAGKNFTFYLGDCVEVMRGLPDNSVDLTVSSIPFGSLYVYSDKAADVGNAASKEEFFEHLAFVIRENLRLTRPGRCCAVHVKDLPLFQNRDGVMGIDPFSDDVTAAYRREGWVLQSRVTIEKDPVIEMQKTNSHGLLMKNWKERAELLRVGLPDYVLIFQKPGDVRESRVQHDPNDETYFGDNPPASHEWLSLPTRGKGDNNYNLPIWQRYANPNWSDVVVPLVWTDIDQTDVLNYLVAKADKDQRHICPLQLGLIGRLIHWKSNPGDVVFDPFGGIGSTGVKALEMNRRFVGIELKPEYHSLGTKYLKEAELLANQPTLFDWAEQQKAAGAE